MPHSLRPDALQHPRLPCPLPSPGVCSNSCPLSWWRVSGSLAAAAAAKSLQLCSTLCDPRDGSPPGSPVPGILQARTLELVAISFSIKSLIVTNYKEAGGFLNSSAVKNPPSNAGDVGSIPGGENIPWGRAWQPTPRFLPGESYGYRSLAGYSP